MVKAPFTQHTKEYGLGNEVQDMTFCQNSAVNFHITSLEVCKSTEIKNKDTSLLFRDDFPQGDAT